MSIDVEVACGVWNPLDQLNLVSRSTPDPLPLRNASTEWVGAANDRLAFLHNIIQRSIDHADIPQRHERHTHQQPPFPTRRSVSETLNSPVQAKLNATDDVAYMSCVEQLLLAQFEGMGRKDIMMECAETYTDLSLMFTKELSNLHATLVSLILETVTRDAETDKDLHRRVTGLILEENSDRQSRTLEEISARSAMLLGFFLTSYSSGLHDKSDILQGALGNSAALLEKSNELSRQLLHWEAKEVNNMPSAQIIAQESNVPSPDKSCENAVVPTSPPVVKMVSRLFSSFPSAFPPACVPDFPNNTSATSYPVFTGIMYRSSVPHVMWQLRLFHFEKGVLRFTKSPTGNPPERKKHWWTVLNACDILHVEIENNEGAIGEAKPPLGRSGSCCFSIYYRKHRELSPRRLRCCCTSQNEALSWVLALRHAMQFASRIGSSGVDSEAPKEIISSNTVEN